MMTEETNMDKAASVAELFSRVSPFSSSHRQYSSFRQPGSTQHKLYWRSQAAMWVSLPLKPPNAKKSIGLAEHSKRDHVSFSEYTACTLDMTLDESMRTNTVYERTSTLDLSLGEDSLRCSVFQERDQGGTIEQAGEQPEFVKSFKEVNFMSSPEDMEEGRIEVPGVEETEDVESNASNCPELPHFTSEWSRKSRLLAMRSQPPLRRNLNDEDSLLGTPGGHTTSDGHGSSGPFRVGSTMAEPARDILESSSAASVVTVDTGHISRAEYALIEESLKKNFMFKNVSRRALRELVLTFERTEPMAGELIVRQGDTCENGYVYVIAEGLCSVEVDGKPVPGPYGTLAPRSVFGEMGVIHKKKRAATIAVKSDNCVVFRAHGKDFMKALNSNATTQRHVHHGDRDPGNHIREIDDAIDQLCGSKTLHGGEIIRQYQPGRLWLWAQWDGTILQHNIRITLFAMFLALIFVVLVRAFAKPTWGLGLAPDEDHPLIERLVMIKKIWLWQTTLCTFVLTFYVNQAYGHFTKIIGLTRSIQGRVHDFMLIPATSTERENGTFTAKTEALLDDVSASVRLFHAFFWASQAERFKCLATPVGFDRMAERGIMTPKQAEVLQNIKTSEDQKFIACIEWMMIRCWQGIDEEVIRPRVTRDLIKMMCDLRSATATVEDDYKSRMPLAYTHFVQLLVDTFLFMSPFALYADLGVYSILCVGMITLSTQACLTLPKSFWIL